MLRCWREEDAPALKEAIDSSLDELRRWMPWAAREPTSLREKRRLLRAFAREFEEGANFVYGIFDRASGDVIGGTGLHRRRGLGDLEIGYWIRSDRVGNGYATETTAVLTRVAFEVLEIDRVVVVVDPKNVASLGVPRKLCFVESETLDGVLLALPGDPTTRAGTVFFLDRAQHPTPAVAAYGFST